MIDIAALTVITSTIIAVAAIVVPLVAPVVAERMKWRREQTAATRGTISRSSQELLAAFAYLWSHDYSRMSVSPSPDQKPGPQVRRQILTAYYQWRAAIWEYSDNDFRAAILEVGDTVETKLNSIDWTSQEGKELQEKLSNRILNLTHRVLMHVR
jgi:hypothetical protein